MKKVILFVLLFPLAFSVAAQIKIVEDFEGSSKLNWTEYADKTMSTIVKNGTLDLDVLSKDVLAIWCDTDLPIMPEQDFKITAKLLVPKIDDENKFGIIIDRDQDFNRLAFLFKEDKFMAYQFCSGDIKSVGESIRIKLPGGKNQRIEVVLERKGGSFIISYNNIEIYKWKRPFYSPNFSFYTTSHLIVEEMVLEQY
ncbi:MAG: hypothetical protein IKY54_04140 [Muribaculaceae bacterium]|nr:hypothetical protein [Muribaculaceae bacterium]